MLRDYQEKLIDDARVAMREHRHICVQAPTGAGKTVVFAEMIRRITGNSFRSWIVVPRNELLDQSSRSLMAAGVSHGRISAGKSESKAYPVHVVSKDTLTRRYSTIQRHPDFMFIDEAHIALDRQIEISAQFPRARMIGFTATPERRDGRGLSELYGALIKGPDLADLVTRGYLSSPRYFCPPLPGLDTVHRRGVDYDEDELEKLFRERRVYGQAIDMYQRHADGLPAICFCRSVHAAEETAAKFRAHGYRAESVDGTMTAKRRAAILDAFRAGGLNLLTSADLLTYGVDLPITQAIIMLRPTTSTALFFQMVGRGLRTADGKSACVILDHVNNIAMHGHPLQPREWNFSGRETAKEKNKQPPPLRLCPAIDFLYCDKPSCSGCPHNPGGTHEKPLPVIDCELKEIQTEIPVPARADAPAYERRLNEMIAAARTIQPGPIGDLLTAARVLGHDWRWVYDQVNGLNHVVNVALLSEMGRQLNYKPGWVWHAVKDVRERAGATRAAPK